MMQAATLNAPRPGDAPAQFWQMLAQLQPACLMATSAHDMALWPLDPARVRIAERQILIDDLAAPVSVADRATIVFVDEATAAFVSVAAVVTTARPGQPVHLDCIEAEVVRGEDEPFLVALATP